MTFCTVVKKKENIQITDVHKLLQSSFVCPTEKPDLSFYMQQKQRCKIIEFFWRQFACTTQFKTQLTAQCTFHREDKYERQNLTSPREK